MITLLNNNDTLSVQPDGSRRAALDRILNAVRAEVSRGTVTALECADWLDYVALRETGLSEVADELTQDEPTADAAATRTGRDSLEAEIALEEAHGPGDAGLMGLARMKALAEELDPLFDEPLAQQGTWL